MTNKIRKAVFTILAVLAGTAAFAVFNERNLGQTLSVLRSELASQNARSHSGTVEAKKNKSVFFRASQKDLATKTSLKL